MAGGGRGEHSPLVTLSRGGILRGENVEFWKLAVSGNWCLHRRTGWFVVSALTERLPPSLPTPFSLRLSGVMLLVQLRGLGASYVQYRHFLSFLAITIDQPRPKFHCVKQLYTPQLSVLFTVHTPHHCLLVTIRISIGDLIGGTRGVSSMVPLCLGTFGCEKNCTDIYCEKIC